MLFENILFLFLKIENKKYKTIFNCQTYFLDILF